MTFTDRISLLELCEQRFRFGTAVEIGVASGCFTKQILASWPSLAKLYAVDAWKHFEDGYSDSCNLDQSTQDQRFEQFKKDMEGNEVVEIIRGLSLEVSTLFLNNSVDFIYLDANHSTPAVTKDLEHWWPKLKPGGIMAGHDYLEGNGAGYGVKAAVDRFAGEWNLQVHQTTEQYTRKSGVYGANWEGRSFILFKD